MNWPPEFAFLLAALAGYGLGSIPFGLVLTKAAGLGDLRAIGSGNIGATNVLRTGRRDLAAATLLLDGGKAAAALLLARWAFGWDTPLGEQAGYVAGAAAFLGHCYPLWLKFKGGKGVASFMGVLIAGAPLIGAIAAATWLAMAAAFRMSSLASLTAAALAPLAALALHQSWWVIGFAALLAALIFLRHRPNIARILAGTEPKIGAKAAPPA